MSKVASSVIYLSVLIIAFVLLDLALIYLGNNFIFDMLNWFNRKKLVWKILILVVGGYVIFVFSLNVFQIGVAVLGQIFFSRFKISTEVLFVAMLLAIINAIIGIVVLWKSANTYNFWSIIELLILSLFIWSLNFTLILRNDKKDD